MITPRSYQVKAVQSIFDYFSDGNTGNPLVLMPTATGKSIVIACFIERAIKSFPQQRILCLTHVKELIEQNVDKLLKVWPSAPVGIHSAALDQRDTKHPILFGGIASAINRVYEFGHIDLMIIDEAHLMSPKSDTMYQQMIFGLKKSNPQLKIIGLTATGFRVGQGMLIEEGGIFTDVCYDITSLHEFNQLIKDGYLCPLIPKHTHVMLDVSNVSIIGGDFNQIELQKAVDRYEISEAAIQEAKVLAEGRNRWLVFGSGIQHVEHITQILNTSGISAQFIHSKMTGDREQVLADHQAGKFLALVNNSILTTGYDDSEIDCIVDLAPTSSPGRHVQKYGRGTRVHPGKENCLVLDFACNTPRNGPINDPVKPRPKGKGTGEVPIKLCPECGAYNHIVVKFCDYCGFEFLFRSSLKSSAGTDEIIRKTDAVIEEFAVDMITYTRHEKKDKASLWVTYYCGFERINEFVCFEHNGMAHKKACDWWRSRHTSEVPKTTEEAKALSLQLRKPKTIRVWTNKKYPEILGCQF